MDRAGYITALGLKAASGSRPVLTAEELGTILDQYPLRDTDGRLADDTAWVPTYDLNAAAAEAWRVKAGKVAGDFTFSADGASYSKADVMAHCLDMEAKFAALGKGSLHLAAVPIDYSWDGTLIP